MTNPFTNFKKAFDAITGSKYRQEQIDFGAAFAQGMDKALEPGEKKDTSKVIRDHRYNEPKTKHKATEEQIDEALESTEIYKRAKELILNAQRGQIGYGIDKYPRTLSADVWNILETIDHILGEDIDKTHYLVMLRIHLERMVKEETIKSKEINKLADFLLRKFPDEIGVGNQKEGESAVDVAIRLLARYKVQDEEQMYEDAKRMHDEHKKQHGTGIYFDGVPLDKHGIFVDGKLIGGVDLANDYPHDPMLGPEIDEYCKADAEATQKMWEATQGGADMDGDYVHDYTVYDNDNRGIFSVSSQPDHENQTKDVSINLTLKHDDGFDALVYTINNELHKMKNRGLI